MFYHAIDPVLVTIGPFQIRYYGLIFVIGILLAYFLFRRLAQKRGLPLSGKDFDDYLLYGVVGAVVGARLGSILSQPGYYLVNPLQVFAIWEGGMAFHGGLLGLVVAGYLFSRRKKVSFYDVADLTVIPVALGLALGRIANFINGEFYGTITSLPWGVKFPGVEGFRHPVQLYESLKNFFIFEVLWLLNSVKGSSANANGAFALLPKGALFWLFITLYGVLRFWLEFYKDLPSLLLGLTWGQLWCIPMVLLGTFMLFRLRIGSALRQRFSQKSQ